MSRIWMCHIMHVNGHVTHMHESCHPHAWVMSHIWMSHVSNLNESCRIYEWVMSNIWMSHVTHVQYFWNASIKERWGHVRHLMWDISHEYWTSTKEALHASTKEVCHMNTHVTHVQYSWSISEMPLRKRRFRRMEESFLTRMNNSFQTYEGCNTLQHTATRCNTPQHTATHAYEEFMSHIKWSTSHIWTRHVTNMNAGMYRRIVKWRRRRRKKRGKK